MNISHVGAAVLSNRFGCSKSLFPRKVDQNINFIRIKGSVLNSLEIEMVRCNIEPI